MYGPCSQHISQETKGNFYEPGSVVVPANVNRLPYQSTGTAFRQYKRQNRVKGRAFEAAFDVLLGEVKRYVVCFLPFACPADCVSLPNLLPWTSAQLCRRKLKK